MYSKIFKNGLPIAAMLLAVAGAFATNATKESKSALLDVPGHFPGSCAPAGIECSTIEWTQMCTVSNVQLYRLDGVSSDCPEPLYKKQ